MLVDLHVHTTASDGTHTPYQVVKMAFELGLKGIAITDHDTIDGIEEGLVASYDYNIDVVPGVELSCDLYGHEVHILGYFINNKNKRLIETLKLLQNERNERIIKIIKKLSRMGIYISYDKVKRIARNSSIGRPHIARALVDSGYVNNTQQAFESLLGKNCPAYVPRKKLFPQEAINLIFNANGFPVLAHPGLLQDFNIIKQVIEKGIRGIEVYYPAHDIKLINELLVIAKKYNLIVTGGSDFHGEYRGAFLGECGISYKIVEEMKKIIY